MEFYQKKESVDYPKRGRRCGPIAIHINKFMQSNDNTLEIKCADERELRTVYNTIYAYTKRRHPLNVTRFKKGLTVYVVKLCRK